VAAGKPGGLSEPTLHPFRTAHDRGSAAKDCREHAPAPEGFKIEVWADGIPERAPMAMATRHAVRHTATRRNVYAVVAAAASAR